MRFGIVAEGRTDYLAIDAVLRDIDPRVETKLLQPDDTTTWFGNGWAGVQTWCQEYEGEKLRTFLRGARPELDGLVIHLDASMAWAVERKRPCPPATDTVNELRRELADWLGRRAPEPWLVPAIPSQLTETWLLAAQRPRYEPPKGEDLECVPWDKIFGELVRRKLLRWKGGRTKEGRKKRQLNKAVAAYRPLINEMVLRWTDVRSGCREAGRLDGELRAALREIAEGRGAGS